MKSAPVSFVSTPGLGQIVARQFSYAQAALRRRLIRAEIAINLAIQFVDDGLAVLIAVEIVGFGGIINYVKQLARGITVMPANQLMPSRPRHPHITILAKLNAAPAGKGGGIIQQRQETAPGVVASVIKHIRDAGIINKGLKQIEMVDELRASLIGE